ncbi:hypothetical protein A4V00_19605 [Hungateiclostridiaceae bacterium KB18]|nr:hypothetical protein A4V00_19605 [Hungateiclostridiaceae bacterium KB18]
MKNLKPSSYNVVVDTLADGRELMFNTLTGAFCVVNETVKALIKEHDCDAEPNQEESRKIVEQLHSLGFLIDDDIDELELIELRRNLTRFNNKSLYVTIGPYAEL